MIEVGQKVANITSGIKGYVTMRSESLTGYVWLYVQPPLKPDDKTVEPKLVSSDECEWKEITGKVDRPAEPRVAAPRFELGSRVKDVVTGFQGIVTERSEHLNRCWSYWVQAESLKKEDGATGPIESFQAPRLRQVDEGLNKNKDRKVKATSTGASPGASAHKGY